MLLAFMYHRVGQGKHTNAKETLRAHLVFLKEHYPIVLPGDPLQKGKLSICLTFDDAFFDFYYFIFPILKELNIRSLIGIPVRYILNSTVLSPEERLSVPYPLAMQDGFFDKKAPFCTWAELNEMVQSGLVEAASHSFMHGNLTFNFIDLNQEIVLSKQIIETRLSQPVNSFIYPFGRTNPTLHKYVSKHYPYAFRIGSSLNWGWGKGKQPIKRIPADRIMDLNTLLKPRRLVRYFLKNYFC
ncbi:MAG: polysaccharide deacetylase family protein [Chlamydiales bacterium]